MNILFLDAYFEPESIAFTHIEHDLLEALIGVGHEVSVVCPTPTRGISQAVRNRYKKIKNEDLYGRRVHVTRFFAPQEGKGAIARLFRYLWCNIRTCCVAKKVGNVDLIFANSTPPTQGMMVGIVKMLKRVPFVYNLQDIFPDSLVNTGMTRKGSILWKIGRVIENFTYRHADKIIVISDDFKRNIMAKGVPEEKVIVVPNWADTKGVHPVERKDNKLIEEYGLDPSLFYVSYSGNIGYTQNMDLLLDVAKEIRERLPEVRFVLIGDGAAKTDVEKRVKGENIGNVIMLPFQPYEDIAHVFSLGDVGLIISKPGVGSNSVPSKTWGYMAAGKPVLASFDEGSELCKIISKVQCGKNAQAGDKEAFITALTEMVNRKDLRIQQGQNGQNYIKNVLDKDKCVSAYVRVLEEVAGR